MHRRHALVNKIARQRERERENQSEEGGENAGQDGSGAAE
jgi:hypothetical protein